MTGQVSQRHVGCGSAINTKKHTHSCSQVNSAWGVAFLLERAKTGALPPTSTSIRISDPIHLETTHPFRLHVSAAVSAPSSTPSQNGRSCLMISLEDVCVINPSQTQSLRGRHLIVDCVTAAAHSRCTVRSLGLKTGQKFIFRRGKC